MADPTAAARDLRAKRRSAQKRDDVKRLKTLFSGFQVGDVVDFYLEFTMGNTEAREPRRAKIVGIDDKGTLTVSEAGFRTHPLNDDEVLYEDKWYPASVIQPLEYSLDAKAMKTVWDPSHMPCCSPMTPEDVAKSI